ncbi:MAG: universal stress protein [Hamadaea sp.]|nr:universal stress protein [Hamadaea sp.]
MPTIVPVRPIVAGFDGSPGGAAAAEYAAYLAELRGAPLHLIATVDLPLAGFLPIGMHDRYAIDDDEILAEVDTRLSTTVKRLQENHPKLTDITARQLTGGPAAVLVEESSRAAVTVVGSRGLGGFAGLLLGSVSAQLAAHGHGPVVVVRPPVTAAETPQAVTPAPNGPVIVGVDSSPGAQFALRFAVDEARRRHTRILAVHAFPVSRSATRDQVAREEAAAASVLADAIDPWLREPGVEIDRRTVASHNVEKTMIEQSALGGLTVVGSRGVGGFAGLLLGSVSRALVHHAHGPVAVIHPTT